MLDNLNEVKQYTSEKVKGTNLIPNRSKHSWIEDHGFYISILEIQPWYGAGCFFNTGVGFLWNGICYFDYSDPNTRVYYDDTVTLHGLITFDDPKRNEKITKSLDIAIARIKKYRELSDIKVLIHALKNRTDTFVCRNDIDRKLQDSDCAFAHIINGELAPAREIFRCIQKYPLYENEVDHMQKLIDILDSGEFIAYINERMSESRINLAKRYSKVKKRTFQF